jgi:hypothetical protein
VKEAKVASEPEALVCFFKELGVPVNRIGLEAGPLSQWLHAGLMQQGTHRSRSGVVPAQVGGLPNCRPCR